jgi:hypothetical protein
MPWEDAKLALPTRAQVAQSKLPVGGGNETAFSQYTGFVCVNLR